MIAFFRSQPGQLLTVNLVLTVVVLLVVFTAFKLGFPLAEAWRWIAFATLCLAAFAAGTSFHSGNEVLGVLVVTILGFASTFTVPIPASFIVLGASVLAYAFFAANLIKARHVTEKKAKFPLFFPSYAALPLLAEETALWLGLLFTACVLMAQIVLAAAVYSKEAARGIA